MDHHIFPEFNSKTFSKHYNEIHFH